MRREPNNEIDLLLRQLSRQNGIPVSEIDEQHLDADELNSYVANALPAKTRTRYTEHLADCSSCRKLVAQLSAAQGPVAVEQAPSVVAPLGFKSLIASFFSPMVLRYAVPALGVIVITVVGIVVLRQERRESASSSVVQVTNTDQRVPAPAAEATPVTKAGDDGLIARETTKEPPPRASVVAPAPVTADAPPPKATPAEEAERQPEAEKKAAPAAEAAPRDVIQTYDEAKANKADQAAKKEKQQEVVATAPSTVMTPSNTAPDSRPAKAAQPAGTGVGVTGVANAPKSRQDLKRSRAQETQGAFMSEETRTVAGRQFRKQGNVWLDAAYNTYQSTTIVTRGTEQYRALIADEPEIHTIAENLKSEFVVVWKGRAYRIR